MPLAVPLMAGPGAMTTVITVSAIRVGGILLATIGTQLLLGGPRTVYEG